MGKAISKGLKRKAEFLLKNLPEKFSTNFEKNKHALLDLGVPFTKLNRNLVAGYIARSIKKQQAV